MNGQLIENATDANYTPTQSGDHTVEVFDANGCSSLSEPCNWITVGIDELSKRITISPDPFSENITVSSESNVEVIDVMNIRGKLLHRFTPNFERFRSNSNDWADGVYHIKVYSAGNVLSKKIIKAN